MVTRVGMVGAGAVATRHAETLRTFPDAAIVAVADPVRERAAALAERCGASVHSDHRGLLARGDLDAVYVCVPPFAHGPPELAAIDAGLPFLVEKPLAAGLATAETIAARSATSGLPTATGYHWRYLDTLEHAQALLADNPPRLVLASWLDKVPPPAWWRRRDGSGGQVIEQATHVLDLARLLAGAVARVSAEQVRTPWADHPDADVPDVSVATLRFVSGAIGTAATTCVLTHLHAAGVAVFAAGLAVELSERELVVTSADGRTAATARGSAKARLDRDFLDVVQGRRPRTRVPYAEALETHRLACAVTRAADEGRTVTLAHEQDA